MNVVCVLELMLNCVLVIFEGIDLKSQTFSWIYVQIALISYREPVKKWSHDGLLTPPDSKMGGAYIKRLLADF